MKPSKKNWPLKECELSVLEWIERKWIVFVLARTNTLGEATEYLDMDETTLFKRRKKYGIPAPPRNSYDGPKLTRQEMADAFVASLVAQAAQPVTPPPNITFVPPAGAAGHVPPSAPSTPVKPCRLPNITFEWLRASEAEHREPLFSAFRPSTPVPGCPPFERGDTDPSGRGRKKGF